MKGAFIKTSFSQNLGKPYISSYQISLLAISPLMNDYDEGRPGYGYELLWEKEIKSDDLTYSFVGFYEALNLPMKNILLKKAEMGLRIILKIPIKTKDLIR